MTVPTADCIQYKWLRAEKAPDLVSIGFRLAMRIYRAPSVLFVVPRFSAVCFSQLLSFPCDASKRDFPVCALLTLFEPAQPQTLQLSATLLDRHADTAGNSGPKTDVEAPARAAVMVNVPIENESFHWRQALKESLTLLVIEQAYVVHTDFNWVVSENGVPFNHFWRDYTQSISEWTHSGWNDGDPNWFGYVGHPIQGALTGFIQIQNDPASEKLEFSRIKAYWWSRFKAALWNAAYSMQWNLGPLGEATVEKYGTKDRPPWNCNGSFPCSRRCLTGVGQIDIVMTPLGGTGWLIGEDFLDSKIVRRVEAATQNRFLIETVRVALNPIRGGANVLHGKPLWYRASRDVEEMTFLSDEKKNRVARSNIPETQVPNRGDVFWGYSHIGAAHCEVPTSGAAAVCDPLASTSSNLSSWRTAPICRGPVRSGAIARRRLG